MIVKMKKLSILISQKHLGSALCGLRKMGLVHIKHVQKPHADLITSLGHKLEALEQAVFLLKGSADQRKDVRETELTSAIKEIVNLDQERSQLVQRLEELEDKMVVVKKIGHVSGGDLAKLEAAGLFIKVYKIDKPALKLIPKDKTIQVIFRKGKEICIAFVGNNADERLDLPELKIPQESQSL